MRLGNQRGIALVAVLWVVAIPALVAAVFMREARIQIALTQNLAEEAKARRWPKPASTGPFSFEYGGGIVQVLMRSRVLVT
jgi:hypothetical protein